MLRWKSVVLAALLLVTAVSVAGCCYNPFQGYRHPCCDPCEVCPDTVCCPDPCPPKRQKMPCCPPPCSPCCP